MKTSRITGQTLPDVARHADAACEGVLAVGRVAGGVGVAVPAIDANQAFAHLQAMNEAQPEALSRIGAGLVRSLETFDVFEEGGGDPAFKIAEAREHLATAAQYARGVAAELAAAQDLLSGQRYHWRTAAGE